MRTAARNRELMPNIVPPGGYLKDFCPVACFKVNLQQIRDIGDSAEHGSSHENKRPRHLAASQQPNRCSQDDCGHKRTVEEQAMHAGRSEERRVGKEWRTRRVAKEDKKR